MTLAGAGANVAVTYRESESEAQQTVTELEVQVTLQAIVSGIAGDLLDPLNGKSAVGVLHAANWSARLLICAEREAVFAIVECMLGGDGSQPTAPDQEGVQDAAVRPSRVR